MTKMRRATTSNSSTVMSQEHARISHLKHPTGRQTILHERNSIVPRSHPHDLLIGVTVWLDMNAGPDAPPNHHPLIARENAAAELFADPEVIPRRRRNPPVLALLPRIRDAFGAHKMGSTSKRHFTSFTSLDGTQKSVRGKNGG
jgi:hypothetical protein